MGNKTKNSPSNKPIISFTCRLFITGTRNIIGYQIFHPNTYWIDDYCGVIVHLCRSLVLLSILWQIAQKSWMETRSVFSILLPDSRLDLSLDFDWVTLPQQELSCSTVEVSLYFLLLCWQSQAFSSLYQVYFQDFHLPINSHQPLWAKASRQHDIATTKPGHYACCDQDELQCYEYFRRAMFLGNNFIFIIINKTFSSRMHFSKYDYVIILNKKHVKSISLFLLPGTVKLNMFYSIV